MVTPNNTTNPDKTLIGVTRLQHALRVIGATASVLDGSGPVSAVLIAPSDAGKSKLLLASQPNNSRVLTDFTYGSLLNLLSKTEQPQPDFIVVPDLNIAVSHKPHVAQLTMALLLSVMGEGIVEIPGLDERAKLKITALQDRGVSVGLLTAMTPDIFRSKRGQWRKTGFLRRLVPLNYHYSAMTERLIQTSIRDGNSGLSYATSAFPILPKQRVIIRAKHAADLEALSDNVTRRQLAWNIIDRDGNKRVQQVTEYPFSAHKICRQLASAAALLRGSRQVTTTDLDTVNDIAKFIRYDRAEEI